MMECHKKKSLPLNENECSYETHTHSFFYHSCKGQCHLMNVIYVNRK